MTTTTSVCCEIIKCLRSVLQHILYFDFCKFQMPMLWNVHVFYLHSEMSMCQKLSQHNVGKKQEVDVM